MCIIRFYWLIALYIFISLVRNASFLIVKKRFSGKNSLMLCFLFRLNFKRSLCKKIFLVSFYLRPLPLFRALPQLSLFPSLTTFRMLDLPIRIHKLKELQTHLRVQIPISTFHVEHRVPTFLPRRIASDCTCKYP